MQLQSSLLSQLASMVFQFWSRFVQSVRLARMGLRIGRAEAKRAAALKGNDAGGVIKLRPLSPQHQKLTPEQMQARIRDLRQSLVRSEQEHREERLQEVEAAAGANVAHLSFEQKQQAAKAKKEEEDRLVAAQLEAFNARLERAVAEEEAAFRKSLQEQSRAAVESAAAFGHVQPEEANLLKDAQEDSSTTAAESTPARADAAAAPNSSTTEDDATRR